MTAMTTGLRTCPNWCTDHEAYADGTEMCNTRHQRIAGAQIAMSNGTLDGDARIFGVHNVGTSDRECLSLADAEALAFYLLGLVRAAQEGGRR